MYSVGAVRVGGGYRVGVYRDERESFWRVVKKCIEEHGHAIIYTDIALKGKYSLCKTIEDVERELSVESSIYDMIRKSGTFSVYYLPVYSERRGSKDTADKFAFIPQYHMDWGHDGRPLLRDWLKFYPKHEHRVGNIDYMATSISSYDRVNVGYNYDIGFYVYALEDGEWVIPTEAQLVQFWDSVAPMCTDWDLLKESATHVRTRRKCWFDGKTRSLAINGLEGFIEYIHNIDLTLLWPVSGPRTCWEKRAVPKDDIVYFRANNYREDEEKFFNEYLWWIMAYYAKGEPMDMIDATVLAQSLADHLVIGAFK